MKKNIREDKRNGVQYAYLLDCIEPIDEKENYVLDASDREKVEWAFKKFNQTHNEPWERKNWPRLQDRVEQWLRGLPTGVHIEYDDYSIEQLGKSWGFCQTEAKAARFVYNYWSVLALRLIELRNILCD